MKIEPCEPCEWADIHSEAKHFVGWDQMPLCDMHFELDKQGRLGNWINENVDFSNEGEAIDAPEPGVVQSGKLSMFPRGTVLEKQWAEPYKPALTAGAVLRKLEEDAWTHLKSAGNGNLYDINLVSYLIRFLNDHEVDTSNLEFSLEQINLRKNG